MFSVIEDRRWFSVSLTNNTFCNLLATAMVADRISSFPSQLCAPPLWKHWGDQLHGTKLSPARGNAYKVTKGKCEIMWAPPGKCPKHLRRKSLSFFPREKLKNWPPLPKYKTCFGDPRMILYGFWTKTRGRSLSFWSSLTHTPTRFSNDICLYFLDISLSGFLRQDTLHVFWRVNSDHDETVWLRHNTQ